MWLIGVVLLGFGIWGLYDAVVVYPRRGERVAEWMEYQYLDQVAKNRPPLDARAAVNDIPAEQARLATQAQQQPLDQVDQAKKAWLEALSLVRRTDATTATAIPREDFRGDKVTDASQRLRDLTEKFTRKGADTPSPLAAWDIPVQWIIFAVGSGLGLYMFAVLAMARRKVFRWEPEARRLTLPGGDNLTPADLEDVDKRRWHKFYVALKVKPGHPTLAGRSVELDLLRYDPVETWVLEMERAAFPDRAEAEQPEEPAPAPAPEAVEGEAPKA